MRPPPRLLTQTKRLTGHRSTPVDNSPSNNADGDLKNGQGKALVLSRFPLLFLSLPSNSHLTAQMLLSVASHTLLQLSLLVLLGSSFSSCSPVKRWIEPSNVDPVALSLDEQRTLVPYANFARCVCCSKIILIYLILTNFCAHLRASCSASYCSAASVLDWSCGGSLCLFAQPLLIVVPPALMPFNLSSSEACNLNGKAKGIASGGNDMLIPGWFVSYDPDLNAIIVAHQGTTISSLTSVLEAVTLVPGPLDQTMFPGKYNHLSTARADRLTLSTRI